MPDKFIDNPPDNRIIPNKQIYAKNIEANYLGLFYMGNLPSTEDLNFKKKHKDKLNTDDFDERKKDNFNRSIENSEEILMYILRKELILDNKNLSKEKYKEEVNKLMNGIELITALRDNKNKVENFGYMLDTLGDLKNLIEYLLQVQNNPLLVIPNPILSPYNNNNDDYHNLYYNLGDANAQFINQIIQHNNTLVVGAPPAPPAAPAPGAPPPPPPGIFNGVVNIDTERIFLKNIEAMMRVKDLLILNPNASTLHQIAAAANISIDAAEILNYANTMRVDATIDNNNFIVNIRKMTKYVLRVATKDIKPYEAQQLHLINSNKFSLFNNYSKIIINKLIDTINNLPKSSNNFIALYDYFYPLLQKISLIDSNLTKLSQSVASEDFEEYIINDNNYAAEFGMNINKLNFYYYLLYYMNQRILSIPKFFYYNIPFRNKETKFVTFNMNSPLIYPKENNVLIPPSLVNTRDELGEFADDEILNNLFKSEPTRKIAYYNFVDNTNFINITKLSSNNWFVPTYNINDRTFNRQNLSNDLPPSAYPYINIFYEFNLIKYMKQIFRQANFNNNPNSPFSQIESLFTTNNLNLGNFLNISVYKQAAELIKDMISARLEHRIKKIVKQIILKYVNSTTRVVDDINVLIPDEPFIIKFGEQEYLDEDIVDGIGFDQINVNKLVNIIKEKPYMNLKEGQVILYPNEYNSLSIQNSLYSSYINPNMDVINILLKNSDYFRLNSNYENFLFSLVKNYRYDILESIRNVIDFRRYYAQSSQFGPHKMIFNNFKSNLDLFEKDLYDTQLNNIKILLKDQELDHLELSFKICQYITRHYLINEVIKCGELNQREINRLTDEVRINCYLDRLNNLYADGLPRTDTYLFIRNKIMKLELVNRKLRESYDENTRAGNVNKLREIDQKINNTNNIIRRLRAIRDLPLFIPDMTGNPFGDLNNPDVPSYKIVPLYNNFLNTTFVNNRGVYLEGFKMLLDEEQQTDCNMIFNDLQQQRRLQSDNDIIRYIKNTFNLNKFKCLSKSAKKYFQDKPYLDFNNHMRFMKDLLIHLTQNIICFQLEILIRKILTEFFRKKYNYNYVELITIVDNFLSVGTNIFYNNRNIKNTYSRILYEVIAEKLVLNSVDKLRKNHVDAKMMQEENIDSIYSEYFNLILNSSSELKSNSYIDNVLNQDVKNYFSSFTQQLISNWYTVIENQFKFVINHNKLCLP